MMLYKEKNLSPLLNSLWYKVLFSFLVLLGPLFLFVYLKPVILSSGEIPYVIFSHPSGIYSDPIELSLSTRKRDVQIRISVDGSNLSPDSETYTTSIQITEPVVIKAQVYKKGKPLGKVFINSYIIGKETNLPIITLTTDPVGLWSAETGIYVFGKYKNYNKRGIEWERPTFMQLYEPGGKLGLEMDLGLRIHGGATRGYAQKGLRIIPRDGYGQNLIHYPIFPELGYDKYRRLLIRHSGNDSKFTLIRDAFIQSLVSDLNLDTQAYRQAILYLNGEYWGIHNIREYHDLRYFKNHYGVKDNTVVVLEPVRSRGGEPAILEGSSGDEKHYQDLIDFVSNNDLNIKENYEYVQTQMDTDNYIDYFSLQIYSGNNDWLDHNIKYWRFKADKYNPEARYGLDGRWRWLVYDLDNGFMDPHYNGLEVFTAKLVNQKKFAPILIRGLLTNDSFKSKFINRQADLLNTIFVPGEVLPKLEKMYDGIKDEIPSHLEKWAEGLDFKQRPSFSSMEEWESNIQGLRDFAAARPDIVRQQYVTKFRLRGTSTIKIDSNPASAGTVIISNIEVINFPQELVYFQSVPIPIKAVPNFGYKFSHWETLGSLLEDSTSAKNSLVSTSDTIELKAVFTSSVLSKVSNLLQSNNDKSASYKLIP